MASAAVVADSKIPTVDTVKAIQYEAIVAFPNGGVNYTITEVFVSLKPSFVFNVGSLADFEKPTFNIRSADEPRLHNIQKEISLTRQFVDQCHQLLQAQQTIQRLQNSLKNDAKQYLTK